MTSSSVAASRAPNPLRMLWPDPAQKHRLTEIRDNFTARIAEAEREGWCGEVEGLRISLAGVEDKLTQIGRRTATTADLGTKTDKKNKTPSSGNRPPAGRPPPTGDRGRGLRCPELPG